MKSAVAIVIDGVLRREIGGQPIPEGLALYRTWVNAYNVVLLADVAEADEELEHFYQVEQLRAHGMTKYAPLSEIDPALARVWQVMSLRNSGYALSWVIEPDPVKSAAIFGQGFNVLHFMHAQYTRPQWRPDERHEVAAWDDLVRRETELKSLKASDNRLAR